VSGRGKGSLGREDSTARSVSCAGRTRNDGMLSFAIFTRCHGLSTVRRQRLTRILRRGRKKSPLWAKYQDFPPGPRLRAGCGRMPRLPADGWVRGMRQHSEFIAARPNLGLEKEKEARALIFLGSSVVPPAFPLRFRTSNPRVEFSHSHSIVFQPWCK
jgi:hypothetical protein